MKICIVVTDVVMALLFFRRKAYVTCGHGIIYHTTLSIK